MWIQRLVRRVWTQGFCPYSLRPGSRRAALSPVQRIHAWCSRHHFRQHPLPVALALWWLAAALWPWRLLSLAGRATRRLGPPVAAHTGTSLARLLWQQIVLGLCHGLPPQEFFRHRLYLRERQAAVRQIIHQHEVTPLTLWLDAEVARLSSERVARQEAVVNNKVCFVAFCARHGLPTPSLLAVVDAGGMHEGDDILPADGPGCDFFVKPALGARGEQTQLWRCSGGVRYARPGGQSLPWDRVAALLQMQARQRPLLLQPLLRNHPAIEEISPNALATARVLTGRTPGGGVEVLAATLKMALRPQDSTNTHGLNGAIDLASGRIGSAFGYHPLSPGFEHHPATGAALAGRVLPDWEQTLALARAAHAPLSRYVFLGWDIAPTLDGPLLLEGNAGWDAAMVQKPQDRPLGAGRFAEICLLWLQQGVDAPLSGQ